ncbi:MAG: TetR-like C-terminal domain-containing protein, partial [Thermocrispum sp.]
TAAALYGGVGDLPQDQTGPDVTVAGVAAWSLMHGFATLWLNGALPDELGEDPVAAARSVAEVLFSG